jgi:hypothetical protein
MEIIVYNPCPVRVLLSSILNHHKRDARARNKSELYSNPKLVMKNKIPDFSKKSGI